MKPNAITTIIGQWRGPRNRSRAAILLALVPLAGMVQAQVTNVIYQDNFARVGPLDGSTPSPVDTSGATWRACNSAPYNAVIMTDGSQICLTNWPNPTNGLYLNGFLPFTPQIGHIYTLSCKMAALSGGANWLSLGFATGAIMNSNFMSYKGGAGWLFVKGDGTQVQASRGLGPGTGTGPTTYTAALGSTTNLFTVVLDTTTGNANYGWTFRLYTNGVQMISGATPYCNYPIKYVGIGANGATGYFQEFTLTDASIRQSAPNIAELPQSTTAQVGQTATFWAGVTDDYPPAAYQWMTNSSGGPASAIQGATNALYTTPPLDMSYDGLNYSVIVTNVYGSLDSTFAPATLTVVSGPPAVYSATKTASPTSLVVAFSKAVDPVTGLNAANYSLSIDSAPSGVSILSANYGALSNSVILTTSMLDTNAGYYLTVQHVKDLFGNAMTSSTVPVLPANLVLYLRADAGVVYDNPWSGQVAQWLDQTTNGNNACQYFGVPTAGYSASSLRPTTNTINGRLALSFGGSGAKPGTFLLARSSPSLESMVSNTTMYAVAQFSQLTSPNNELVNKTWGNIPAPFDWIVTTSQSVQYGNGGNNAPAGGSGTTITANTPYVLTSTITFPVSGGTTNFNFYLNGNANGNGVLRSVVQGLYDGGQPLYIGSRSDFVNWTRGQFAEIMLFNTALSGADRTNVDNYLGAKYFPFMITIDLPSSTTTSNGFAVTYTFAANLGSTHRFALQWQKNGTNIPGANALTYTTPILAPGDNGAKFAVMVSLPNGSVVYSSTNTLTVLTVAPYVTWAGIPIWNTNQVLVLFDEAVDPGTATLAGNYLLDKGANVLAAALGDEPNKVILTTSPLAWNANPGFYTLTVQNVKNGYGNPIVTAASAVGLYPSAALWVRADRGVLTNWDGTVSEWDDLSGNANNLYQGPTAPLFATNTWGDLVIRFTATNATYMTANSSPSLAITGDMSIIAAMNFAAFIGGTNGHVVSKSVGNIGAPYDLYMGTPNALMYRGNGGTGGNGVSYGQFTATSGPQAGMPCVVGMSETGDIISHYVNGRLAGTGLLSNGYHESSNADAGTPLYIGARADLHNRLAGDMSELIIANTPVSSADMTSLANYLATQHHFVLFNTSPTNLVFSGSGGNLTLGWPADYTGWQLQSNSVGLTATSAWFTVAGSTATNQMTITPDAKQTNAFYRLLYQP